MFGLNNKILVFLEKISLIIYIFFIAFFGLTNHRSPGIILTYTCFFSSLLTIFTNQKTLIYKYLTKRWFLILLSIQSLGWILAIRNNYYSLKYNNFDTGIFANLIYTFFTTGSYYSSVMQVHGLGDHFSPILMLFSQLYRFSFSFLLLLYCKVIAFLTCAYLLTILAKQILGKDSEFIYIIPIFFLTNCYVATTLAMEFQPSSLALPLIVYIFILAEKNYLYTSCLISLLLVAFKEHMPLILISLGIFLIIHKKKYALGTVTMLIAIFMGIYLHFYVMPLFSMTNENLHLSKFGPFELWSEKIYFVTKILLSVGLLPLFSPKSLLFILPAFGISLVSKEPQMLKLIFHYHDIGMVMTMIGSIYGLKELNYHLYKIYFTFKNFRFSTINLVQFICLTSLLITSKFPSNVIRKNIPTNNEIKIVQQIEGFSNIILNNSSPQCLPSKIFAMDNLGPYLFRFKNLRTIYTDSDKFFTDNHEIVLLAPNVAKIPLTEDEFNNLSTRLISAAKFGKIKKVVDKFDQLEIFVGKNLSENCFN